MSLNSVPFKNNILVYVKCGDNICHIFDIRRIYIQKLNEIETVVQLIDKFRRLFRMRYNESLYTTICQFFDELGYTSFNYFHIPDMSNNISMKNVYDISSVIILDDIIIPLLDNDLTDLEFATYITFALLK